MSLTGISRKRIAKASMSSERVIGKIVFPWFIKECELILGIMLMSGYGEPGFVSSELPACHPTVVA